MLYVDYYNLPLATGVGIVCVGAGTFCGFIANNFDASNTGSINIFDGADDNGDLIISLAVTPGQTITSTLAHDGVRFKHGLYAIYSDLWISMTIFAALDALQPAQRT